MGGLTIDAFLGHRDRGERRQKTMADWTSNPENLVVDERTGKKHYAMDTWLHRRAPIVPLWRHVWKRIVVREKNGQKTR